jgi:diketogulonate reductase-like aldo/keto reductase
MVKGTGKIRDHLIHCELCTDKPQNIIVAAYSPLGNNIYNLSRAVDDPAVINLAKHLNKQPAQLLISWAVQRGTVVLPKSVTASRIADNFQGKFRSLRNFDQILTASQILNSLKECLTKLLPWIDIIDTIFLLVWVLIFSGRSPKRA